MNFRAGLLLLLAVIRFIPGQELPAKPAPAPRRPAAPRFLFFSNLGAGYAERARTVETKTRAFGESAEPFTLMAIDAGIWKPFTRQLQLRVYGSFGAGSDERALRPGAPLNVGDSLEYHDLRDVESHAFFLLGAEGVYMPGEEGRVLPFFFAGGGFYRYGLTAVKEIDDRSPYDGQRVTYEGESSWSRMGACLLLGSGYMVPANFGGLFFQIKARYWSPIGYTRDVFGYLLEVTERQWNLLAEAGILF